MVYNGQELKMKKVFLTMTLIAGVMAGAMTLSAFTKSTKTESVLEITASPVWEGTAREGSFSGSKSVSNMPSRFINIRVYPSDNSCGTYYAVIVKNGSEGNVHYTVKNNPDYDYTCSRRLVIDCYSHYITVGSNNYFFKM